MSEHILKTIELLQQEIQDAEADLSEKKKLVNMLCPRAGISPLYAETVSAGTTASIRSDEFYGKALATAVREVLQKRAAANRGAASVNEIYEVLVAGGYHFTAKNDDYAKRGLYQSLQKNTAMFHKLPNGTYGLREWYKSIKRSKAAAESDEVDEIDDEGVVDGSDVESLAEESGSEQRAPVKPR